MHHNQLLQMDYWYVDHDPTARDEVSIVVDKVEVSINVHEANNQERGKLAVRQSVVTEDGDSDGDKYVYRSVYTDIVFHMGTPIFHRLSRIKDQNTGSQATYPELGLK